uniref:Cl40696_1 n=1 Tax=Arundo donax TaxID=35708 RepID=A0A0A8YMQ1_ARUDO
MTQSNRKLQAVVMTVQEQLLPC